MKKQICMLLSVLMISFCLTGCLKTKVVVYEDYQGPILPLSINSEADGVVAQREIVCDYTNYNYSAVYGENSNRKVTIYDQYTLTNTTKEDMVLELVYGFPGRYSTGMSMVPRMKIDGEAVDAELVAGGNPLRYQEKYIKASDRKNQITLNNRECFELLLEDGEYIKDVLKSYENVPVLSETVTIYKFEDVGYSGENNAIESPGAKIFFEFDPEKTDVYSYGMNSCNEEDGITSLGFDVPRKGGSSYGKEVYVIAAGDELKIQDVKCYHHRWSDKETDEFTLEYVEYESTFEEVLSEIVNLYKYEYTDLSNLDCIYDSMTTMKVLNAGKQCIVDMKEINHNGQIVAPLEDYLFDLYGDYRVFYRIEEVTVPANGSIEVALEYEKFAGIKNIEDENYDGLEIMTSLGSDLEFQKQTLKVVGLDELNISEHTTGDELESGQYEVEMKDEYFEIYLEVPEREYVDRGYLMF